MTPITLQRLVKELDKLKPEPDAARLKSPDYARWLARMIRQLRERGLDADRAAPQQRSRRRSSGEPSWLRSRRIYPTRRQRALPTGRNNGEVAALPRSTRPALACSRNDPPRTQRPTPPRADRETQRHRRQPVVELEPRRPGAVPLDRPGAVAPHPAQSHRVAATGGSRAARRLRPGSRLLAALRRR